MHSSTFVLYKLDSTAVIAGSVMGVIAVIIIAVVIVVIVCIAIWYYRRRNEGRDRGMCVVHVCACGVRAWCVCLHVCVCVHV